MASKKRSTFNEQCPICFELFGKRKTISFSCGHSYHERCFQKVSKPECPYCRKEIRSELPKSLIKKINQNKSQRDDDLTRNADREHALMVSQDILFRIGFIGDPYISTYFTDNDPAENVPLALQVERICNFHFEESRKGLINETKNRSFL